MAVDDDDDDDELQQQQQLILVQSSRPLQSWDIQIASPMHSPVYWSFLHSAYLGHGTVTVLRRAEQSASCEDATNKLSRRERTFRRYLWPCESTCLLSTSISTLYCPPGRLLSLFVLLPADSRGAPWLTSILKQRNHTPFSVRCCPLASHFRVAYLWPYKYDVIHEYEVSGQFGPTKPLSNHCSVSRSPC